ncbi:hypothetical protein GCM10009760_52560 [Kitasatospora kazusensis]|uniref:Helix-turn-helix domain-containing protein n=1 Tax=Kitasatospora kazusensis TaxID=407974 RepID=A0ABN3A508_9ACTN
MSIHLMILASYLPKDLVNPTQKLMMQKLADSADDETRLSRPGMNRMVAWVGVGEKRCTTIITELVAKGLVERVEVGRPGRAAVYRVFPLAVPEMPKADDLRAQRLVANKAPKNPNLARKGVKRAAPSKAARTYLDLMGKETPAEMVSAADGFPQGNPVPEGEQVPPGEPIRFPQGNPAGSPAGTPSFPSPASSFPFPPTPVAGATGGPAPAAGDDDPSSAAQLEGCPAHRKAAGNCRACGTSPRAQLAKQDVARKEAARAQEGQFWQDWHSEAEQRRNQAQRGAQALQAARQEARAVVAKARGRLQK